MRMIRSPVRAEGREAGQAAFYVTALRGVKERPGLRRRQFASRRQSAVRRLVRCLTGLAGLPTLRGVSVYGPVSTGDR